MINVSKYVDMDAPLFKDKSDFEIWHMMDDTTRMMVAIEYIGDRVEKAIMELGEKVGSAVIAVTTVSKDETKIRD